MFGCTFCREFKSNINMYICGDCVQRLLYASDEKIIEARDLALAKGCVDKVEAIENFTGINIPKGGVGGKELKQRKKLSKTTKDEKMGGKDVRFATRKLRRHT